MTVEKEEWLEALLNGRFIPTALTTSSPVIRLAQPADREALFALSDGRLTPFQFRQHMAQLLKWQAAQRCCWLVVEAIDGRPKTEDRYTAPPSSVLRPLSLIGSGQLISYPHAAELANLSVAPAWRGQGWGTRLIETLTAVAHHWQIAYLEITVDEENGRALALYQRLGFTEDRRLFLPDGRSAIVLGKEIVNCEL
jgi:ribosomal protein S18 acetylase RimI-like enzyme